MTAIVPEKLRIHFLRTTTAPAVPESMAIGYGGLLFGEFAQE
jgi:hypothetical protein